MSNKRRLWDPFFRTSNPGMERQKHDADVLRWNRDEETKKFIAWLREQADEPVNAKSHGDLLAMTQRNNTFKEILKHLTSELADAERRMERANERVQSA